MLRQRPLLQHLAQSGSGPTERRLAILGWQGNEAFLRGAMSPQEQQWLEQVRQVDRASLAPKLRHNLPEWLAQPLLARLGEQQFWALAASMNEQAPLDLRVNTLKTKREEAQAVLAAAGIAAELTPFSPLGLRIHGKPALNKLELFTGGGVEVQDEGSQLLALLLDAKRSEMVVDFCAGAGGKTLALGASMRNTGRLYAFDTSGHRLASLKPRLARSGLSNIYPTQIAHERDERIKRLAGKIDRVLVDAPCSGLGTLRRNPDLKWRQSLHAVQELQLKQEAILASAARLLKSGGAPGLCHLQPARRRERGDRRGLLGRSPSVQEAARRRGLGARPCQPARASGGERLPAPVAASASDGRLLRCGVGEAVSAGRG